MRLSSSLDQEINTPAAGDAAWLFDAALATLRGVMNDYARHSSEYRRGDGAVIAMLDTGVLPPLQSEWFEHYEAGLDMVSDASISLDCDGRDSDPSDMYDSNMRQDYEAQNCLAKSFHGTRMGSIVAGKGLPSQNFSGGIAPGATLLSVRVLGQCSRGYASDVADGIVWSVGGTINGWPRNTKAQAGIVLMAFSGKGRCPSYLQSAVTLARERYGATLFAAAGNDASFVSENFPANCEGVTSVGALDEMYKVAPYSALGARLYLPGIGVPCAYPLGARSAENVRRRIRPFPCMHTSIQIPP